MIRPKWSAIFGGALVALALASSGGCGSGQPVQSEEAKAAELKELEVQAKANDAASKAASRPRSNVGVMPP